MEYVDGAPLDEYCRRTGSDARSIVDLITRVCHAVEYLHDKAIVHRD